MIAFMEYEHKGTKRDGSGNEHRKCMMYNTNECPQTLLCMSKLSNLCKYDYSNMKLIVGIARSQTWLCFLKFAQSYEILREDMSTTLETSICHH